MSSNKENIITALQFMPPSQAHCFEDGLRGEEHRYFEDIADKLARIINSAPSIYETDELGEEVKPVLHYFYGNVDIYITEIDRSDTNRLFGYTSLGMGYLEFGEIHTTPIFQQLPLLNLDFNFTPKTIREYRKLHT